MLSCWRRRSPCIASHRTGSTSAIDARARSRVSEMVMAADSFLPGRAPSRRSPRRHARRLSSHEPVTPRRASMPASARTAATRLRPGSPRRGGSSAAHPCSRRRSTRVRHAPARHRARDRSPSPSCATMPAASVASGTPETLADVIGSGPTPRASVRGASWSGTRSPIVGAPAGQHRRQRDVGALRDDHGQPAGPARRREDALPPVS